VRGVLGFRRAAFVAPSLTAFTALPSGAAADPGGGSAAAPEREAVSTKATYVLQATPRNRPFDAVPRCSGGEGFEPRGTDRPPAIFETSAIWLNHAR